MEVTQEWINQFKTAYNNKYDCNMDNQLALLPRSMSSNAFITRVSEFVDLYIKEHCPLFVESMASTEQQQAIYNAKLEQAYYILWNEDLTIVNGIDFAKGVAISQDVLKKAEVSRMALKFLETAGLLYRGINNAATQYYGNDYWRDHH